MVWMLLVLLYGVLKGLRDVIKKKALEKSSVVETLFCYTLLGFIFVLPDVKNAGGLEVSQLGWIAFKSFIIFVAFLCSFYTIEKMPISLYGVLDLSRMLFAMLLGVIILQETLGLYQIIGLVLVSGGLLLLRYRPGFMKAITKSEGRDKVAVYVLVLAFVSTFLNAVSGIMDKILMKSMTSGQLQFWYMLFMVIYYALYVLITKTKIHWKTVWKNYYIWLLSIFFIIADRALFMANAYADSRVTIMTLIKQSCCIVTIIGGKIVFKEKDITYKLFCAAVVVAGIVVSVL